MEDDHDDHVKVKVADLKAHLSQHLRQLRETGNPIEVCVRENPVAYLTRAEAGVPDVAGARAAEELRLRLRAAGLTLVAAGAAGKRGLPRLKASIAGDGRTNLATVTALRAAKDW
jgi:antitoxin (DNA-binding transcriptional repressor) of toxin-antitoxin stability system